jgi:hypothetical protein
MNKHRQNNHGCVGFIAGFLMFIICAIIAWFGTN